MCERSGNTLGAEKLGGPHKSVATVLDKNQESV